MHTSCVVEDVGGPCQPLCAERERKIMLVFQQPTVSFEILLVSRVAVGRTEAKTRVAIGAETGFSSPQTDCRMLRGRGAPVRELIEVKRNSGSRPSDLVSWDAEERRVV